MLPFRSRSINRGTIIQIVLDTRAQFLIKKFWLSNNALIPSSVGTLLFKELALKIFCPQDRLKCTREPVNRSWLLWCECRLSSALKQVMGDIDWRNGWLLWSHLEWRELIIHMPIKHRHTHTHATFLSSANQGLCQNYTSKDAGLFSICHVFHQICPHHRLSWHRWQRCTVQLLHVRFDLIYM